MEKLYLGIELGSTRIKCSLIDDNGITLACGIYEWENIIVNSYYSYSLEKALMGVSKCYMDMKHSYFQKTNKTITKLECIGISAMMHGLIALDKERKLLTPFRTWRNNSASDAALKLSNLLDFNIPARWSIAHLYDVIDKKEDFALNIEYIETLASYIHYALTDTRAIGIGDASGIFPISNGTYNKAYLNKVSNLFKENGFDKDLLKVFPPIYKTGETSGILTLKGANILDTEHDLLPGIPFCPPEGDAQTGMIATNTITKGSANISCGTSIFGNFVLKKPLKQRHDEIDIVVTPCGDPVAMIHCNNCTSAINACYAFVKDTLESFDIHKDTNEIYQIMFEKAMNSNIDLKDYVLYNYFSNENITHVNDGAMLLSFANKSNIELGTLTLLALFSCFVTFSIGMDILNEENVEIDNIYVHGGIFKTKDYAQKIFASILNKKIYLNDNVSEGGPYGMALLAMYHAYSDKYSLMEFLNAKIFKEKALAISIPDTNIRTCFEKYKENFIKCLEEERKLGEKLKRC